MTIGRRILGEQHHPVRVAALEMRKMRKGDGQVVHGQRLAAGIGENRRNLVDRRRDADSGRGNKNGKRTQ